jgi:hypothetical protein
LIAWWCYGTASRQCASHFAGCTAAAGGLRAARGNAGEITVLPMGVSRHQPEQSGYEAQRPSRWQLVPREFHRISPFIGSAAG